MKTLHRRLKLRLKRFSQQLYLIRGHRTLFVLWILVSTTAIASLWIVDYSRRAEELTALQEVAKREAASLSAAYAQQMVRAIEKLDDLTALFQYQWETSGRTLRLENLAERGLLNIDHFAAFLIVNAHGNSVTSTRPNRSDAKFDDRRYFKQHMADPSSALKISTPTIGKISNQRVIHVTRRINKPDGSFDGVLVVSVANDFFTPISNESVFGKDGLQAIVGDDDEVRVGLIGGEFPALPMSALRASPECMPHQQPALIDGSCFSDNNARFVATTAFASYPFKAVVGLSEREILQPYLQQKKEYRHFLMVMSSMIAFSGLFAMLLSALLILKRAEASEIRKAYRLATENGKDGFYLWRKVEDEEGVVCDFQMVDCNARGAAMYGRTKSELVGTTFTQQYGETPYRDFMVASYRKVFETGHGEDDIEVPAQSLLKAKWLHRKYVRTFEGLAVTHSDIGDKIAIEQEMSRRALQDSLTGLPNRYWLTQNLPLILVEAEQTASRVAVLFLDLDDFKNVNDSRGHSTGDELLRAAAGRLSNAIRPDDHVARFGGDEFTVVMRNVIDHSQVTTLASRISETFKKPFFVNGGENLVGTSIGIAIYPNDGGDTETLLKNADIAMYAAKVNKGGYRLYSQDLYASRQARLVTEQEILRALKEDEFVIFYQPRVRPDNRKIINSSACRKSSPPSSSSALCSSSCYKASPSSSPLTAAPAIKPTPIQQIPATRFKASVCPSTRCLSCSPSPASSSSSSPAPTSSRRCAPPPSSSPPEPSSIPSAFTAPANPDKNIAGIHNNAPPRTPNPHNGSSSRPKAALFAAAKKPLYFAFAVACSYPLTTAPGILSKVPEQINGQPHSQTRSRRTPKPSTHHVSPNHSPHPV